MRRSKELDAGWRKGLIDDDRPEQLCVHAPAVSRPHAEHSCSETGQLNI